mmetsp:Transcript_33071/g.45850  ORF Transcript_33071/g.45850 Transcript_33071/m.45850 type:complete len:105 (+) Transcript_33071:203-517(+)|eukprot:CAMPEP_0196579020 /NCGR_PEP_ID=MMETSP1081-20130531/15713_1 /TAXON_ID=36882 /ORGANISM="Pyramimonas amylifera, Strain CCMP720" /LENGTH=104 /DNA_ID=CAMNT_0041898449 /DNA_START=202 /DNA_END=516 /DNA_ORIENTATION=+
MPRIYFPKIPLILQKPDNLEAAQVATELVFRTIPSIGKIQLRNFLQSVYNLDVAAVHTINYEGKKKRHPRTGLYYRRPDWKKAYVYLNTPSVTSPVTEPPLVEK